MWDYFNLKLCLNVPQRTDRWNQFQDEVERVGLTDVIRFEAIPDIGPHQSFCASQKGMLAKFLESDAQTFLALEDDVEFKDLSHLPDALKELPDNWDILFLGANIIQEDKPQRYSQHLFHLQHCWTTHAVAYRREIAERILKEFPLHIMYDHWLQQEILPHVNTFVVAPMVAWQRPSYSDIWQTHADYDSHFIKSNDMLK